MGVALRRGEDACGLPLALAEMTVGGACHETAGCRVLLHLAQQVMEVVRRQG